jgi:hypothetical protein
VSGRGKDATEVGTTTAQAATAGCGLDVAGPQGDGHPRQRLWVILTQDPVGDETAVALDIQPGQIDIPE